MVCCGAVVGVACAQPLFECLVEPFEFALRLRVVAVTVLLGDVKFADDVFEVVGPAFAVCDSGGEDQAVVGHDRGRDMIPGDIALNMAAVASSAFDASNVLEQRGMSVSELAELSANLRAKGGLFQY